MQTPMYGLATPMTSTWPAPKRQTRLACTIVIRPLTTMALKTAQGRYSGTPAARTTMAGVMTSAAAFRAASWAASVRVVSGGGVSCGS